MRPKLTYANVMATIAVFIALGGASYAALKLPKNSIGSKQLKKNAVTTAKIKNEAVTAAKVKNGTLTGTQINASTLGTVPTAQRAQTAQTAETANAVAAPEPWHEVGAPGEPIFQNGCNNYPPQFELTRAGFYKDREGVVHLEGYFTFCESTGDTGFQLPVGYRPGAGQTFAVPGGVLGIRQAGVEDPGSVYCTVELCALNGITFRP